MNIFDEYTNSIIIISSEEVQQALGLLAPTLSASPVSRDNKTT